MKKNILGIDIGGTKCAISYGIYAKEQINIVDKEIFQTTKKNETINTLLQKMASMINRYKLDKTQISSIGISCGGPLDSKHGIIMSPPNLLDWKNVPIVEIIEKKFQIKAQLQNDANACALAEWKFGAGRGTSNMIFLTFGTGLGAGIILDGKLYTGTNDNAGEIGHIRLSEFGPVGYGKKGSFEGFCSGGGISQLARDFVYERIQMGQNVSWCDRNKINEITAKQVAEAAYNGDPLALQIYKTSAKFMGRGLSILIDILNPEIIVLGGIYTRNETMMNSTVVEYISKEALTLSAGVCQIKSAELEENIGDYGALSVAINV